MCHFKEIEIGFINILFPYWVEQCPNLVFPPYIGWGTTIGLYSIPAQSHPQRQQKSPARGQENKNETMILSIFMKKVKIRSKSFKNQ